MLFKPCTLEQLPKKRLPEGYFDAGRCGRKFNKAPCDNKKAGHYLRTEDGSNDPKCPVRCVGADGGVDTGLMKGKQNGKQSHELL